MSIVNKIVWGRKRKVRKPYRAFSIYRTIINCGKSKDFMSINPFDVLIDWLISLFRAFCFIVEEILFNVYGLETFMLQLVWRRINPPSHFVKSSLTFFKKIIITNSINSFTFKVFSCSNTKENLLCKMKKKLECFNVCWEKNNARFAKRKIHKIIHIIIIVFCLGSSKH